MPTLAKRELGERIFVVHGHDRAIKSEVARTLTKLTGQDPIILHEQADKSRTIIQKFEDHAGEVAFAVVLLTGDDEGGIRGSGSMCACAPERRVRTRLFHRVHGS